MSKKKKKGFSPPETTSNAVGDINVTPLIDIVLVLLIIYMVVTPVMLNQFLVNLPEKTETMDEDDIPDEQLLVAACLDGSYTLKSTKTPLPEIVSTLRKKINRKRKRNRSLCRRTPRSIIPSGCKAWMRYEKQGNKVATMWRSVWRTLKEEKGPRL